MFEIGSCVVYRSEGVCQIIDIRTEPFGGRGPGERYYILSPKSDPKSTLFVPVENETLTAQMRPLLSAEEIDDLCEELRSGRMEWIPESRARNHAFREILSAGDRRELIVLVHTLWEQMEAQAKEGKKATATDQNAYRRARKLLYDEFCTTAALESEDDVLSLIRGEKTLTAKV